MNGSCAEQSPEHGNEMAPAWGYCVMGLLLKGITGYEVIHVRNVRVQNGRTSNARYPQESANNSG
jgi:hypothetical protein